LRFVCDDCSQLDRDKISLQSRFSGDVHLEFRGKMLWRVKTTRDNPHYDETAIFYTIAPQLSSARRYFAELATSVNAQFDGCGKLIPILEENVTYECFEFGL
jgi:hypothetical protein